MSPRVGAALPFWLDRPDEEAPGIALQARRAGLAVGVGVFHTHHHRVGDLARPRRPAVLAHVADDDRSLAEAQLRAMVLADAYTLDEPERRAQPLHRRSHVRVDQDGDHGRGWD